MTDFREAADAYAERMNNTVYVVTYRNDKAVKIIAVGKTRLEAHALMELTRKESADVNPANYQITEVEMDKIHENLDIF